MFLNNRNLVLGKDGQANLVGDIIQNVGSPMQTAGPVLNRTDTDLLIKVVIFIAIILFQYLLLLNYIALVHTCSYSFC